ncbi:MULTISPECIES: GGDEF domain-containing protein [Lysinibacillus]|uniref:GGDEF domain-containing protein n=1 Tax=Lysinibacillus antri TaxID=2498145 RepID=A0A432L894_9BACI|nr:MULTISPECIES: GGDEF domain-containing protein [Lysinibacillus]RUL48206.1 GGDEF domain-containing protein [Lysinibacillus antri]TSI10747.1 GGDEF domain-containing protein [Lysinibacillus sp. BW-2-10]
MKQNNIYWIMIVLFTVLPILINSLLSDEVSKNHHFIWSLFLIPSILMMSMYPKWSVIISSAVFYSSFKLVIAFFQNPDVDKNAITVLILGSMVNWSIHITIGYFINKSHKLLQLVEELTLVDVLTGINNRRYFNLFLEKTIPNIEKTNSSLIMMTLDIDHFKRINDTYGHSCGDEALKHISNVIRRNVRDTDAYVRIGGEEFAIVMPSTSLEEGGIIAERLRKTVEESSFTYKQEVIQFTISIGLSQYHGEAIEDFINKADKALYQAKENGRNNIVVFV